MILSIFSHVNVGLVEKEKSDTHGNVNENGNARFNAS